jgi:excinuclease ABC subunit C
MKLPPACIVHPHDDLEFVEDKPAVFALWAAQGEPYLAKTNFLRRRLRRLLGDSRWASLRGVAERVEYWPTGSRLAANILHYTLAREYFPETYQQRIKLRYPAYVRLVTNNAYPRTTVTSRFTGAESLFYGPFRSRAAAEELEGQFLDLFQIRRCQEDLAPAPDHPGCIYGEMNMCLRPCQEMVGEAEYASEVARVREFLTSDGQSLLLTVERARDRASENLDFEEASRQHRRLEKVQQVLRARDEMVRDSAQLCGVAVTKSTIAGCVELRFFLNGQWLPGLNFRLDGAGISMDSRLKLLAATLEPETKISLSRRQDHLALLSRWYYSSWRDGEWLGFPHRDELPYRKLVRAISRVAGQEQTAFTF